MQLDGGVPWGPLRVPHPRLVWAVDNDGALSESRLHLLPPPPWPPEQKNDVLIISISFILIVTNDIFGINFVFLYSCVGNNLTNLLKTEEVQDTLVTRTIHTGKEKRCHCHSIQ